MKISDKVPPPPPPFSKQPPPPILPTPPFLWEKSEPPFQGKFRNLKPRNNPEINVWQSDAAPRNT